WLQGLHESDVEWEPRWLEVLYMTGKLQASLRLGLGVKRGLVSSMWKGDGDDWVFGKLAIAAGYDVPVPDLSLEDVGSDEHRRTIAMALALREDLAEAEDMCDYVARVLAEDCRQVLYAHFSLWYLIEHPAFFQSSRELDSDRLRSAAAIFSRISKTTPLLAGYF